MKIIGIDPGLNASGVAIFDGKYEYKSLKLWQLYNFILANSSAFFVVENSNLDRGNYHGPKARGNVGKNKAVSKLIVDYCEHLGVDFMQLKPDGYSKRYTDGKGRYTDLHKRLFQQESGYTGQTNKHERAATAMIVANKLLISKHIELCKNKQANSNS